LTSGTGSLGIYHTIKKDNSFIKKNIILLTIDGLDTGGAEDSFNISHLTLMSL